MYAIEVPDGAKPGDPIKVRLPDGVTVVKITVPEGAGPGTTLEFELPSEEAGSTPREHHKRHDDEPAAVPARLHSEEKVRMNALDGDLTNAAPERIYVLTLPPGVVPGKPIVAEIMDGSGATVLVPVPRGARAGRELLFRVQGGLEDEAAPKLKVYRKGALKKISPKSNLAMTIWQTRWFELTDECLMYWDVSRPDGVEKKGTVPVGQLIGVRMHQTEKTRFDLLLANKRLFQLKAKNEEEREAWGKAMQKALVDAATAQAGGAPAAAQSMQSLQLSDVEQDDAAMSMREDAGEEVGNAQKEEEEEEEEEHAEEITTRSKSQFVNAAKETPGAAGDAAPVMAANPVIETGVYMSRVQRARMANAAKRQQD
ncbi:hypothetical protein AB1Y20_014617 [Prymnesium parvum]|uniref:PH domain-containing protein n=1 Tax=Prymnesium parvum TaxID=97485 RepID=A0AB34ICK0_PRYPA